MCFKKCRTFAADENGGIIYLQSFSNPLLNVRNVKHVCIIQILLYYTWQRMQ